METANKNKTNKKFMILSFFGILMVVSGHIGGGNPINIFGEFFPINSFFMPMFIFISGYFFKDEYLLSFKKFFIKKSKKLLLYYLIWNIFYGIVMKILFKVGLTTVNMHITLKTIFISPFIDGQQFYLNAPAWFLPTLFTVELLYWFLRRVSKNKIYNLFVFILFLALNIVSVSISKDNSTYSILLPLLKIMFFMFFYILGFYYKLYFEAKDEKINPIITIFVLMIINSIILKINPNVHFSGLYSMSGFLNSNIFIPAITGITGIYFFLKLSQLLQNSLKDNKIVNLISGYTKEICMHHIFCMYSLSVTIYLLNSCFEFSLYDKTKFLNIPGWYFYLFNNRTFSIIYFLVGIFGSILIAKLSEKIVLFIKERFKCKKLK